MPQKMRAIPRVNDDDIDDAEGPEGDLMDVSDGNGSSTDSDTDHSGDSDIGGYTCF